ncbi:MAG: D-cysteine desulfhydrase family protein [Thiotrichales bacterium]|nr:D-cysteine desulfhydrase family protein [Thiotrichales bacterium]
MPGPLAGVDRFPRTRLGHIPTPLDPAPNLGAALGVELWVKRDDCTGLAMGGNKVRQLEFYLGEARAHGADTVLITGAVQSNFVRLAAAGARQLGMDIHIQLEERVDDADDLYRTSGNVLLDRLLGATLHSFPVGEDEAAADAALEHLARLLADEGRRPYVIHLGADHPPLGGLGYVLAANEVMEQARARGFGFDAVVCASGSSLTHAGTLIGMRAIGEGMPVRGICVRRDASLQHARVAKRAAELAAMIDRSAVFDASDIDVSDEVYPPGYGKLNDAVREAISMAARHEALLLDPVYTGKAMAGLIAHVRSGRIATGSRVLFLHTGGLPGIFAYAAKLESCLTMEDGDAKRVASGTLPADRIVDCRSD